MLGQTVGFPSDRGAGSLTQALRRRFEAAGGTVVCSTPVTGVRVEGRRAVAVRTADAEGARAPRRPGRRRGRAAVRRLVAADDLPSRTTRKMGGFRRDPATFKIDYALDGRFRGPGRLRTPPARCTSADSVAEMTVSSAQIDAGVVPRDRSSSWDR